VYQIATIFPFAIKLKAFMAIFRLIEIVARAVVTLINICKTADSGSFYFFLELFFQFLQSLGIAQIQAFDIFVVFFLGQLLVEKTIGLIHQIGAAETIRAIAAIVQKIRIDAAVAVFTGNQSKAGKAVHNIVTKFIVLRSQHILRILGKTGPVQIPGIFAPARAKNQITIFVVINIITVLGIYRVHQLERLQRRPFQKFVKLLKKGLRKIVFPAIFQRVPFTAPPVFLVVNRVRRIRRVHA
jgi:hypothetical protein